MNQIEAVFQAVADRCKERGATILPRGVIQMRVGGLSTVVQVIADEISELLPANKAGRAVIAVAEFAQKATKILESDRLTGSAKAEDVTALARASAPELQSLMDEVDAALEAAVLVERREVAPVPIEPADASQAVVDVELRGIARASGGIADQMRAVQSEFAICRAVLRQPVGFPAPVIEHARKAWAEFNPAAKTVTLAHRQVTSWRAARQIVGQCQSALNRLSSGRDRMPGTLAA